MADFENVAAIRGAALSDLSQYVSDVLAVALPEDEEYQVGSLVLDAYDFVPYALTGLAAAMQTPPGNELRATTHVVIPVRDEAGGTDEAHRDVTVYGPGDVLGVDAGQIVRRYPAPGSTNAEETFHAHIEFDRPELPWAFSAQTAGERMRPWLVLVVVERDELEWEPAQAGLQPIMAVEAENLPGLDDAWAWAHAQTVPGATDPTVAPSMSARLSTAYAPVNVSRLLASRVLRQHTNYVACLVPATSVGVQAGLGIAGGGLGPAWTRQDGRVRLPVYDRWEFRTAPDGDFARLARRLKGVAAPWRIGRRTMDTSRPGDPLTDLAPDEQGRRIVVRCALYSPADRPPGEPDDTVGWAPPRIADLKTALERPAVVEGTAGTDPGAIPDLPIVGPRIYAKGQRGRNTIVGSDWFAELNLSPVHRVVAGLGTRVVARDQETLMQAAWAQVGEVEAANRALALAELARNLAEATHAKLAKVDPGRLLQLVRPLAARVKLEGNTLTVAGQTARSATPPAALGGAFRRALRPTGPIARRLATSEGAALARIVGTDVANRDFARPYLEPDGITGLSDVAREALSPDAVGRALGVDPGEAMDALARAADRLATTQTLAHTVSTPAAWKAPDETFRPGRAIADRVAATLQRYAPADPATDVVRARWVGGLAAGAASTRALGGGAGGAGGGGRSVLDLALGLDTSVTGALTRPGGGVVDRPGGGVGGVVVDRPGGGVGGVVVDRPGGGLGGVVVRPGGPVRPGGIVRPVRTTGAEMLRAGAARRDGIPIGLSPIAAGAIGVTINRPVGRPTAGATATITDRQRLEQFATPQGRELATWLEQADTVSVAAVRAEVASLVAATGALALAPTPTRDVLPIGRTELLATLSPRRTVVGAMKARLEQGRFEFDPFLGDLIRPIMAAPRFDRPMYQALNEYDTEWLVPGLTTLEEPELVTLLAMNDQFTESFLVGLSDEMGRELLWRGYPTDSRGTYFHRFWNPAADELQQPIHRFSRTALGRHVGFGSVAESGRAVVVVRGELVRRYPDLSVWALRESGRDADDHPLLPEAPKGLPDAAPSLFHAMLPPDILLAGLDITIDQLKQEPGWWIVLAEHPQATRFRREEPDADHGVPRFGNAGGSASGAQVAGDRLEHPTRVAFEADDFLPEPKRRIDA